MNRVDIDLTETTVSPEPVTSLAAEPDAAADIVETVDLVEGDQGETKGLPPTARLNKDGSVTLKLTYPVTLTVRRSDQVIEDRYEAFTLRRLNGADLRAALQLKTDLQGIALFARSAGLKQLVAEKLSDKMDLADFDAVAQVVDFFGSNGRKTGR